MSQNDEMVDAANAHLQKVYERERAGEIAALRDHFAAQAAQGAISGHFAHYGHANYWEAEGIADYAYDVADAMLSRRKVGAE